MPALFGRLSSNHIIPLAPCFWTIPAGWSRPRLRLLCLGGVGVAQVLQAAQVLPRPARLPRTGPVDHRDPPDAGGACPGRLQGEHNRAPRRVGNRAMSNPISLLHFLAMTAMTAMTAISTGLYHYNAALFPPRRRGDVWRWRWGGTLHIHGSRKTQTSPPTLFLLFYNLQSIDI